MRNYGELVEAVSAYLYDRKDLQAIAKTFVALSERRIYRLLRCPANEHQVYITQTENPYFGLPRDFLEMKFITVDGRPIERISDLDYYQRTHNKPAGEVKRFARIADRIQLEPQQDGPIDISYVYWADYSGQLVNDADTNEILRIAPDLYVFAALMQASAYLGQDSRIPVWDQMFQKAFVEIAQQRDEAEYAGSLITMSGAYDDWGRNR